MMRCGETPQEKKHERNTPPLGVASRYVQFNKASRL